MEKLIIILPPLLTAIYFILIINEKNKKIKSLENIINDKKSQIDKLTFLSNTYKRSLKIDTAIQGKDITVYLIRKYDNDVDSFVTTYVHDNKVILKTQTSVDLLLDNIK
jgi:hypothetical protein